MPQFLRRFGHVSHLVMAAHLCAGCNSGAAPPTTHPPTSAPVPAALPTLQEYPQEGGPAVVGAHDLSSYQSALLARLANARPIDEVFALETSYIGFGGLKGVIEVANGGNRAELRYYEGSYLRPRTDRYFRRSLRPADFEALRRFVADRRIDQSRNRDSGAFDGVAYLWTHVRGSEGHRLWLNNPDEDWQPETDLLRRMQALLNAEPMECVYNHQLPKGAKLLYADPRRMVKRFWLARGQFYVQTYDVYVTDEKWMHFGSGKWKPCDRPDGAPAKPADERAPAALPDITGMDSPVVIPGRHLAVGSVDQKLICWDLQKREKVPFANGEDLGQFQAFEYFPERNEVLLVRRTVGPYGPARLLEWRLLNAETLRSTPFEFDYWAQKAYDHPQSLQPTSIQDEYWASFANEGYQHTNIVRFSRKRLEVGGLNAFRLDGIVVANDKIWIDEPSRQAYIVYDGQLLQVPVPKEALESDRQPGAMRSTPVACVGTLCEEMFHFNPPRCDEGRSCQGQNGS